MPDITMCINKECPLRMKCYRFTAVPTLDWQSYAEYKPVNGKCDSFLDNTGYRSRFDTKDKPDVQTTTIGLEIPDEEE